MAVSEASGAVWHVSVCLPGLFLPCVHVLEQLYSLGQPELNEKAALLVTHWW